MQHHRPTGVQWPRVVDRGGAVNQVHVLRDVLAASQPQSSWTVCWAWRLGLWPPAWMCFPWVFGHQHMQQRAASGALGTRLPGLQAGAAPYCCLDLGLSSDSLGAGGEAAPRHPQMPKAVVGLPPTIGYMDSQGE